MNGGRPVEDPHYTNPSFPYTPPGSFMDFFHGVAHVPVNYPPVTPLQAQENLYWSMNTNAYKFGFSGPENASYYSPYGINDQLSRMSIGRTSWEYVNVDGPATTGQQDEDNSDSDAHSESEECSPNVQTTSSSPQESWQDSIDPDNMTYEELLELGEAVGTQSRGLSQELIDSLPTTKYTFGSIFSRKKSCERCVICQLRYKIGDRQIKLPCKHVYHSECISKWLGINKVCPVCNNEVLGEESKH